MPVARARGRVKPQRASTGRPYGRAGREGGLRGLGYEDIKGAALGACEHSTKEYTSIASWGEQRRPMPLTQKILAHRAIGLPRPWVETGDMLRLRVD